MSEAAEWLHNVGWPSSTPTQSLRATDSPDVPPPQPLAGLLVVEIGPATASRLHDLIATQRRLRSTLDGHWLVGSQPDGRPAQGHGAAATSKLLIRRSRVLEFSRYVFWVNICESESASRCTTRSAIWRSSVAIPAPTGIATMIRRPSSWATRTGSARSRSPATSTPTS